ncbi:26S proteasome non-ATPase regulatory subunit 7 [Tribonema minus]|uniref:26S proteasome non-ATPase regulatory subunit 7 n=1 Tax=Tribonema minus TaxID=303371 RepID=A0A835Z1W9_9STRA|nr:26S proteasome non-ATPase regulatory subunit 7 [Tribonema minus]
MPADPMHTESAKDDAAEAAAAAALTAALPDLEVVVHPLVLLSVVDHYNRVAKDTKKRAVGVLLGSKYKGTVDVTNSFAVPFEEDSRNPSVWYLDHNFLESMFGMFKKVAAKERIVGFYSTGPKIRENDLKIAALFKRFCSDPLYVIVDVRTGVEGMPTTAYRTAEEVEGEGKEIQTTFKHVPSSIGALEAEEVGVEHLLRDINDPSVSTLANQIKHKMAALAGLRERLEEVQTYLKAVQSGALPVNNQIIYNLQDIFNLLPNLNTEELVRSMLVKTNDIHLVIYISALTRSIVALHDLVLNKIKYKDLDDTGLPEEGDKPKAAAATNGTKGKEGEDTSKGKGKDGEKPADKK